MRGGCSPRIYSAGARGRTFTRASDAANPNPSCLARAEESDAGSPEWVNHLNNTGSDELAIIGMDAFPPSRFGSFTRETSLRP